MDSRYRDSQSHCGTPLDLQCFSKKGSKSWLHELNEQALFPQHHRKGGCPRGLGIALLPALLEGFSLCFPMEETKIPSDDWEPPGPSDKCQAEREEEEAKSRLPLISLLSFHLSLVRPPDFSHLNHCNSLQSCAP